MSKTKVQYDRRARPRQAQAAQNDLRYMVNDRNMSMTWIAKKVGITASSLRTYVKDIPDHDMAATVAVKISKLAEEIREMDKIPAESYRYYAQTEIMKRVRNQRKSVTKREVSVAVGGVIPVKVEELISMRNMIDRLLAA